MRQENGSVARKIKKNKSNRDIYGSEVDDEKAMQDLSDLENSDLENK